MTRTLHTRVERLEAQGAGITLYRPCPDCGRLIVWSGSADTCDSHTLAPDPLPPGTIRIERSYGNPTDQGGSE